jgi:hypothetical protein
VTTILNTPIQSVGRILNLSYVKAGGTYSNRLALKGFNIITFKLEMRFNSGWLPLRAVIGAVHD